MSPPPPPPEPPSRPLLAKRTPSREEALAAAVRRAEAAAFDAAIAWDRHPDTMEKALLDLRDAFSAIARLVEDSRKAPCDPKPIEASRGGPRFPWCRTHRQPYDVCFEDAAAEVTR